MKNIKNFFMNNYMIIFIAYFTTLFIETTSLVVDYPILESISKSVRYITYLMFFTRLVLLLPEYKKTIFNTPWKDKPGLIKFTYIILIIMILSLMICVIKTSNIRMMFLILILLSAYRTEYDKIIKTTMIMQMFLTSIIVVLSVLNITQDFIVARGEIERHSLGFLYTTNLVQMFIFSSILHIYIVGSKIKYKDLFVMQLTNALLYALTNTRSEFMIFEMIIVITIIIKLLRKYNKEDTILKFKQDYSREFTSIFPILPVFSLVWVICYKYGGIWNNINKLLSNRLKQTYENIILYGIKPFGDKIVFLGLGLKDKIMYGNYSSNYVDNEYLKMMFTEGWIFTSCFVIILSILLVMLYNKRRYKEIMLCSIYLLFGLINPRIVNVLYCPILFMIIPTFIDYKEKKQNINEKINN